MDGKIVMNNNTVSEDGAPTFQVIAPRKPDYRYQRVACVFCASIMKWLSGMPEGHGQWICENCGSLAYEGYGDTPAHNTDPQSKLLVSPNDPYEYGALGLDAGGDMAKPMFNDLPEPELDHEIDETFDELRARGRPPIKRVSDAPGSASGIKRRYGMMHDIRTAQEASGLI